MSSGIACVSFLMLVVRLLAVWVPADGVGGLGEAGPLPPGWRLSAGLNVVTYLIASASVSWQRSAPAVHPLPAQPGRVLGQPHQRPDGTPPLVPDL